MTFQPRDQLDVPVWVETVLRLVVGGRRAESIAGDLLERYREVPRPAGARDVGYRHAGRWYARELVGFVRPWQWGLALGIGSAIVIVVTNVVLPTLGFDAIDAAPGGEAVLNAACFAATAFVWGLVAALAGRETGVGASVRAGAIVALVHISLVMLTFAVMNNLFFGIVSRQPDKIWGFIHSGDPTMRAYVNYAALRGLMLVLPIAVALGALCGATGGVVGGWRATRRAGRL